MDGDLRELADDHVDGRAEEEAGHGRTGEELSHPAHLQHGEHQEEKAGGQRQAGHEGGDVALTGQSGRRDAMAATAASPELGPMEIRRQVPKRAWMAPAAAA